ncbi:hypothetical protein QBC46DRAFT_337988 [Diplogelasinospora grovesii]|uniref:Uncharacterized protein n=1 Tax=Diplogelasinospora grovesii TaxID=303347 RepID=A0AAN6NDT9_9PEZI|nr:hypothetical protein QBC46DRAFT_337988 [Diplogelasinospora grovesii]
MSRNGNVRNGTFLEVVVVNNDKERPSHNGILMGTELFTWRRTSRRVCVNGADQGTLRAIRTPAYNSPPPRGYANSAVKDLDSIDLRGNVLGDTQHTSIPTPELFTTQVSVRTDLLLDQDYHHDFVQNNLSDPRARGMVRSLGRDDGCQCRSDIRCQYRNALEQLDFEIGRDHGSIRRQLYRDYCDFDISSVVVHRLCDTHRGAVET